MIEADQREHAQLFPQPGWVEHDPLEIWANTQAVIAGALAKAGRASSDLSAVGITNQRETCVVWNKRTGLPVCPAIVWQDTRTDAICVRLGGEQGASRFRERSGLPLATYFTGPKITWVLENVPGARDAAEQGELLAGTIDSWLIWNLTGGPDGGRHLTDVTNASRTLLMDLRTLAWDEEAVAAHGIPASMLAQIVPSSGVFGHGHPDGPLPGVPLAAALGDQQAATFGQVCFTPGMAKNTYGTGTFLLMNTGTEPVLSQHGLLTTVAYQVGEQAPVYALEGSVAVAGAGVQWLRDNLGLIQDAAQVQELAASVQDNGGAYFVPAFSGLFAPRWRSDARGAWVGLTRYINRGHLARGVLEATAYQTVEVVAAMNADSGVALKELRVDGGMVANDLLMQFQADVLGTDVIAPQIHETTALGAAYAAGLATGVWSGTSELSELWVQGARWSPTMTEPARAQLLAGWDKAVQRTLNWADS